MKNTILSNSKAGPTPETNSTFLRKFLQDARIWLDSRCENARPGWMVAQLPLVEAAMASATNDAPVSNPSGKISLYSGRTNDPVPEGWGLNTTYLSMTYREADTIQAFRFEVGLEDYVQARIHGAKDSPVSISGQHPDDLAVDQFFAAMKAKLDRKRRQGYGGWDDKAKCSNEQLSAMLRDHIDKGDPIDVANFAMMIYQRGERIAAAYPDTLRRALRTALDHIEHMATWIGKQKTGYSFEGLGEDMPGMRDALDAPTPETSPMDAREAANVSGAEAPWQWFAGDCGEWFAVGPEDTREAIIQAATNDSLGEYEDDGVWKLQFHIVEARKEPLRIADWIDADDIFDRAEDNLADSDRVGSESDEGPWFECSKEQKADLRNRIKQACDEWQVAHGLVFNCATFSQTRNEESVVVDVSIAALSATTEAKP